jgi:ribonuclease HII
LREPEAELARRGYRCIAGVDEAGRGPLAGPVVAAACCIPCDVWIGGVDDSKRLTAKRRKRIYDQLTAHPRIQYGIGCVDAAQIDTLNIYQATLQAMSLAVAALPSPPDYLLIDGNALPHTPHPATALVGGDARSYLIAAASIIAKEYRDQLMLLLDAEWPHYGFAKHKGYGTATHLQALRMHGPSTCHRRSFAPIKNWLAVS